MMRSHQVTRSPSHQIMSGVLVLLLFAGCAGAKEACRGFAGTSTKILEEHKGSAIVKEFAYDITTCTSNARKALLDTGSYIYREDRAEQLIAVYVSETDTTPVGLFFRTTDKGKTQILFSSPSTYAKELIAGRVEKALTAVR